MAIVRSQDEGPFSEERLDDLIPALKEKAKRVVHSNELHHEDERIDKAKIILCNHYKIPMKSPIFESYTLEDLVYEAFLLIEMQNALKPEEEKHKDAQEKTVEVIKENSDTLKSLFDELRMPEPSISSPSEGITDNLFSKEEQESAWNKVMDGDGFF